MSDFPKILGLLSGGDIEIIEFHPPPMELGFQAEARTLVNPWPEVWVKIGFSAKATLDYALVSNICVVMPHSVPLQLLSSTCMPQVLDSKGIREAIQEKNPLKAFNSFAIRDVIDGVGEYVGIMVCLCDVTKLG
jgi:hypothetical protein